MSSTNTCEMPNCDKPCAPGKDSKGDPFTKCHKGCRGTCKMSGCTKPCYLGRYASGRRMTKCKIKCRGVQTKEVCQMCEEECDSLFIMKDKTEVCKTCSVLNN